MQQSVGLAEDKVLFSFGPDVELDTKPAVRVTRRPRPLIAVQYDKKPLDPEPWTAVCGRGETCSSGQANIRPRLYWIEWV